jgi:hypothetical protein
MIAVMPRPKSEKDRTVTIALPGSWLEEAEGVAKDWSARDDRGVLFTRADVLRAAMRRGLDGFVTERVAVARVDRKGAR